MHAGGLRKDKKVQKHKSAKWHGNEEQTNTSIYHMLQSCGVQAGSICYNPEVSKLGATWRQR